MQHEGEGKTRKSWKHVSGTKAARAKVGKMEASSKGGGRKAAGACKDKRAALRMVGWGSWGQLVHERE